ncbi:hypothetical protein [Phenylobacterium sp.]|jgi:hypothetical protein|uniref:hypothetical protein n=1 Tax=Phenylobacterium sp. TaxID=1871053 RepID=UPI002F951263
MRRRKCETVTEMEARGWDVLAKCQACGLTTRVNLRHVARIRGPAFSLWNRRARCKRVACPGAAQFLGRAPDMSWHEPLDAPWPEGKPPPA